MTTPTLIDPAEVASRPASADRVRHGLALTLGVAGPILFLLGGLIGPDLSGTNAQVMAALPAVADRLLTAHLLNTIGCLAYVATVLLTWRLPTPRGAVLRLIGGCVAIIGLLSNALGETLDAYTGWAGVQAHVPAAQLGRLFDVLDDASVALPVSWLAIPVLGIGAVVLWVGVLRAHRFVPIWAPIAAIVGTLAAVAIGGSGILQLIGAVGTVGSIATMLLVQRALRA